MKMKYKMLAILAICISLTSVSMATKLRVVPLYSLDDKRVTSVGFFTDIGNATTVITGGNITTLPANNITSGNFTGIYNFTHTGDNITVFGDLKIIGTLYGGSPVKISGGINASGTSFFNDINVDSCVGCAIINGTNVNADNITAKNILVFESLRVNNTFLLNISADNASMILINGTQFVFRVHRFDPGNVRMQFSNEQTGSGGNDGSLLGILSSGELRFSNQENQPITFLTNGITRMNIANSGSVTITHNLTANNLFIGSANDGKIYTDSTAPTLSDCGTGASVPSATSSVSGRVTIGSTLLQSTCTLIFDDPWTPNAPSCIVNDETTHLTTLKVIATTTNMTITTADGSGFPNDVINWICIGYIA